MRRAMVTEAKAHRTGLPHSVFLQRVTDEPATSALVRLGQGAFLALRFVDLLSPDREAPTPDVFRYQWAATERYCAELAGEGTEASHLSCIVRATGEAHRTGEVHLIAPSLFAYALFLEQESHLDEAEDVLLTMIAVGDSRLLITDTVTAWLRLARVRRMLTDWESSLTAYAMAGRIAAAAGDRQSVLLSRVGRCNVMHFRGNLADAETAWRDVLKDATDQGFRAVQAQAEHGLGTVLERRGRPQEGIPHLWRAYELYEDDSSRMRALGDLGLVLLAIGQVADAEQALNEVVRRETVADNLSNAKIELMNCASFRRDRVTFERWRERALAHAAESPPNIRTDYHLKAGIGYARFENYARAEQELRRALEIATTHELHEFVFRIERLISRLEDCAARDDLDDAVPEPADPSEALREISASLAALGE
ncbi:MAG TPA: tetratricopeptide repeat protein [Gemmatimonadales bacterium]|nr:tetratricopeptide repeat protein [Gemmatimonadales bacterium]